MPSLPPEIAHSLSTATAMRPLNSADLISDARLRRENNIVVDKRHWLRELAGNALRESADHVQDATGERIGPHVSDVARDGGTASAHVAGDPSTPGGERAHVVEVLGRLLEERRSDLTAGKAPAAALLSCLHTLGSARLLRLDEAGRLWQSRRQPSAGGTHSIEPLLHAGDVDGLAPGWYCQVGSTHGEVASVPMPDAARLSTDARQALSSDLTPAAVVYGICDPVLLGNRYPEGSSLLWRDAGAFLMTIHLLAHAHGLSSTILGLCVPIGNRREAAPTLAGPDVEAYAVGAVAIGGPAAPGRE